MEEQIKILEEQKDYYVGEIDGKKVKLFKINVEEIKQKHENDLYLASRHLSNSDVEYTLLLSKRLIQYTPTVEEYEAAAKELCSLMEKLYKKLQPHDLSHLFHHLIKDTNPEIYGKAQTFMKQIHLLHYNLEKIIFYINE